MVLSEEEQLDAYPAATMELSQASVETALYSNVEETRSAKPAGYPADTYTDPNNYVAKLNGYGNKVGPGIVLKVMSGDRVNIRASSWYYLNGADPGTPVNPLNDLLNVLATGVTTVVTDFGKFTRTDLISNGILSPGLGSMLDEQTASYSNGTKPKAYLSWILLDEQFRLVSSSSGFEQVGADGELKIWVKTNLPINRNGYLYVYTSNESPVDVFFDNLQVSHIRGPLLEETHYYPFGLAMRGISSKAAGKLENKYKYNGIELNEDLGLNTYDAFYRNLDPQIGRFWQIDPKIESAEAWSPYSAMLNNPIRYADPLGDSAYPIKNQWNDKYINKYNSYVNKKAGELASKGVKCTCEDFALTTIMDFSKENGLPFKIQNNSGEGGSPVTLDAASDKYTDYETFKNDVLKTTGAPDLQNNANTLPADNTLKSQEFQPGTIILNRNKDGKATHVQMVAANGYAKDGSPVALIAQGNSGWLNVIPSGGLGGNPRSPLYTGKSLEKGVYDVKRDYYLNATTGKEYQNFSKERNIETRVWNFKNFK